jgi:hypothetical protein
MVVIRFADYLSGDVLSGNADAIYDERACIEVEGGTNGLVQSSIL